MGTYRTKPEEVEAIQFTGNPGEPFTERTPGWVWAAFSGGTLTFSAYGMTISYNGLSEHVSPNDWLVMSHDKVIRACEDKVFRQYYTPYRQRRTKAEIEADRQAKAIAGIVATGDGVMIPITDDMTEDDLEAVVAKVRGAMENVTTEGDSEEMERALAACFPEIFTKNTNVVAA